MIGRNKRTRAPAFTLVELLTVIAIITLLIGILTPALGAARDKAKNTAIKAQLNAMEVGLADSPRANEILLALVMTTGPRVHARVGGLKASEIKGEDGLR